MDSVVTTRTFDGDLEAMVRHCRSLEARKAWPGAVLSWETGEALYYQVSMRLKAATMTDISVEERIGDALRRPDGSVAFSTTQRVTWPDGAADADTEYVCTPGSPNTVQFTYRYEPPSTKLVKRKALPAFHVGMERVVGRYLDGLTATAVSATSV